MQTVRHFGAAVFHCDVLPECLGFLSIGKKLTKKTSLRSVVSDSHRLVRGEVDGMNWRVLRPEKEMPAILVTGGFYRHVCASVCVVCEDTVKFLMSATVLLLFFKGMLQCFFSLISMLPL